MILTTEYGANNYEHCIISVPQPICINRQTFASKNPVNLLLCDSSLLAKIF